MGVLRTVTRTLVFGVLAASLGLVMFGMTINHDDDAIGSFVRSAGVQAGRIGRKFRSPAPVVKPKAPPPYRAYVGDVFNLRGCQCLKDFAELQKAAGPEGVPGLCRCRGLCPPKVDPAFLTAAAGQSLCSLEEVTGYNCYAECEHAGSEDVRWFATPCNGGGQDMCDKPILASRKLQREKDAAGGAAPPAPPADAKLPPAPEAAPAEAEAPAPAAAAEEKQEAAAVPAPPAPAPEAPSKEEAAEAPSKEEAAAAPSARDFFDLRGLKCELLNDKPQCYYEDAQGRERCPEFVTPEWLSDPKDQFLCQAESSDKYFCTAGCQEGNPEVRWGAHEIAWCNANRGNCPTRDPPVPKAGFSLKPWSEVPEPPKKCQLAKAAGATVGKDSLAELTVGMLTHEPRSMKVSLATYEAHGFFDLVPEFLIYANKRSPAIDAEIEPYIKKYGSKIKVLGDATNVGIARGIIALTNNATRPYFLFLERDFKLIEPDTCVYEQLSTGLTMLKENKAQVVRYRHRKRAGRPNWAEKMFRGHEDDAWRGGQPNLGCNVYYWVPEPEKRWPDKIWVCNTETTQMYCSDSFYCNWTNNPQMWSVEWWNKEYVSKFDEFKSNDPYYDLEVYMNWEGGGSSWNNRKFTVAQGDGLFEHKDAGNFGIV